MCRHLAYLGPPVPLRSVLLDPPHGLYRQSWAPRMQRHGTVNADGFGVGWYAAGDPVPARYRRAVPIWADASLPDVARVIMSAAVLAAVRDATAGTALGETAVAPFASGPWLFSHNGALAGWPASAAALSSASCGSPGSPGSCGAEALLSLEALTDSAFLWLLVLGRLRAGAPLATALTATIGAIEAAGGRDGPDRFNFLLTDGRSIAATTDGEALCYRQAGGAVTVASEPCDDEPGWTGVPDRQVLTATAARVTVRPIGPPAGGQLTQGPLTEGIGTR
jgi:gamma-glutamyl hercynylcysteine S-oxide hydrolase